MITVIGEALTSNELHQKLTAAIRDRVLGPDADGYAWVCDVALDEPWCVYEHDDHYYRISYTVDADGNVTLVGEPVEVDRNVEYKPVRTSESTRTDLASDVVALTEGALRRDGTIAVKIIQPGWSENGRYYSAEMLEANRHVFARGTQMFWDHPTVVESQERPERSLRDLAAVFVSEARWEPNGTAGPGLYADAKVFEAFRQPIAELAPHIGVSIRAAGTGRRGEAEGRRGLIVEEITHAASVDFVTVPGAGGEVLSLFESAREGMSPKEGVMPDPSHELTEARAAVQQLTTQLAEATALGTLAAAERDQLRTENARLHEAALVGAAKTAARKVLAEAKLPEATRDRLVETVAVDPPHIDGRLDEAKFGERIAAAIKTEREYLAKVTGSGQPVGLGESVTPTGESQSTEKLTEAFRQLGMSETAAAIAAEGR